MIRRVACSYGYPENNNARRKESWDSLRKMTTLSNLPWCAVGDFNEMLTEAEKVGGRQRRISWLMGFREALTDCHLSGTISLANEVEGDQLGWWRG